MFIWLNTYTLYIYSENQYCRPYTFCLLLGLLWSCRNFLTDILRFIRLFFLLFTIYEPAIYFTKGCYFLLLGDTFFDIHPSSPSGNFFFDLLLTLTKQYCSSYFAFFSIVLLSALLLLLLLVLSFSLLSNLFFVLLALFSSFMILLLPKLEKFLLEE